jgi:PPOX class probable F420-dependent enzyme
VPVTFAVIEPDTVVTAVDDKPKRTRRLARLENVARDDRVTLLVDHYDDADWSALWWVRLRGRARIVPGGPIFERAVKALVAKYPQYAKRDPKGPVISIDVADWRGWTASAG